MTAVVDLKRALVRAGRWGASHPVTRTVTALTGLQGRFHRGYWRHRFEAADGRCVRTLDGTTVDLRAATPDEFRHCWQLMDERDVVRDVCASVGPEDVFYDVGAYLGVYSCFVGVRHPSARVVAFEPDPHRLGLLVRNAAANGLEVDAHGYVLSDATGTVSFATDRGPGSPNCSRIATDEPVDATIHRPMRRADALIERGEIPAPDVVKLDVEGGELDALRGMATTLRRGPCRLVYCEVHPTLLPEFGATAADVHAVLSDAGFEVTRLGERGQEHFLRASRPSTSGA